MAMPTRCKNVSATAAWSHSRSLFTNCMALSSRLTARRPQLVDVCWFGLKLLTVLQHDSANMAIQRIDIGGSLKATQRLLIKSARLPTIEWKSTVAELRLVLIATRYSFLIASHDGLRWKRQIMLGKQATVIDWRPRPSRRTCSGVGCVHATALAAPASLIAQDSGSRRQHLDERSQLNTRDISINSSRTVGSRSRRDVRALVSHICSRRVVVVVFIGCCRRRMFHVVDATSTLLALLLLLLLLLILHALCLVECMTSAPGLFRSVSSSSSSPS